MTWLRVAILVGTLVLGTGLGWRVAGEQEEKRVAECAKGIKQSDFSRCPTPITDAFSHLELEAARTTIEYRDRTIPVFVNDGQEDALRYAQLQAELLALTQEVRSNACAASPAFERRRLQLCAEVGGPDCPGAGQDPR